MLKWRDFSKTDWENAHYCQECGLPTIKDKEGNYYCVHCTEVDKWRKYVKRLEDEKLHQVEEYKTEIKNLKEEISTIKKEQLNLNLISNIREEWKNPNLESPIEGKQYTVKCLNYHGQEEIYTDYYMGFGRWQNTNNVHRYKEM